jgi:hypothetical protein
VGRCCLSTSRVPLKDKKGMMKVSYGPERELLGLGLKGYMCILPR